MASAVVGFPDTSMPTGILAIDEGRLEAVAVLHKFWEVGVRLAL
jgi:hypothetical protein